MDIFDTIFVDGATNIFGTVFNYTVSDVPTWSISFVGSESCTGTLTAKDTVSTFTIRTTAGELVVSEATP